MDSKFLQSFLKTGLFDIGESDERLKWLKSAIDELQKKLKEDYSLLPIYTLVALDPNVSDTEQTLIDTESIITHYWESLRVRFKEMPRNIIRGVILNALNNIGMDDPLAARIIFLTGLNFFPYAKLNTEKGLVEDMLSFLGDISEKKAIEEWALIEEEPSLKIGILKVTDFKFGTTQIDQSSLRDRMKVAISDDPRGYGVQNGGNSTWGNHFADKSSEAISMAFDTAISEFNKSLSPTSIETPINKFFSDFKKALDSALKTSFSSLLAVERRSKLLWWKETLYSPSMKVSYRELNKNLLPIIMGIDLNNQVPKITPVSVDYLLKDTLFLLNGKKDESLSFATYLSEVSEQRIKSILKPYFVTVPEKTGKLTITDFICLIVNDRISASYFKERTGIDATEEITFGELSVVVLHDLLIQRLIAK